MSLAVRLALRGDLAAFSADTKKRLLTSEARARDLMGARLKLALRGVTRPALGDRVANAWQYKGYPTGGRLSYRPAGLVYSKAPKIVAAFSNDTTIVAVNGSAFLAIPTENTPRRGRRLATPVEVEAIFNQDLIFIHGRGQQMLAFVDAIKAKSGRGFRRPTRRRLKDGRQNELVLMFVMVRQVHLRKRIDLAQIEVQAATDWQAIMGSEIARGLSA